MDTEIYRKLNDLEERVRSGDYIANAKNVAEFGGADVRITKKMTPGIKKWLGDQPVVISLQNSAPIRRVVITEYSKELSWLLYRLRDIYHDQIDFISKYDFFGLLAQTAIDYLDTTEDPDRDELLLAVIQGSRQFPTSP